MNILHLWTSPRTGIKILPPPPPPPPMQRPRLVFRGQYPTTQKLRTSPQKLSTRPISMSCHVENTAHAALFTRQRRPYVQSHHAHTRTHAHTHTHHRHTHTHHTRTTHAHTHTRTHTHHHTSPQTRTHITIATFTAKRNLCFCLCMCYGNAMFKMHSGKLDKHLTYCKGVIKPNFSYTDVIINHTWSIAIGSDLIRVT